MESRWNSDKRRLEILVDTPVGKVWQSASQKERPAENPMPYASPYGQQPIYQAPATQEEELFGDEFGSVVGDALSGNQKLVGSGGKKGGGRKPYAQPPPMAPWVSGAQSPLYLEQLRKKRYA